MLPSFVTVVEEWVKEKVKELIDEYFTHCTSGHKPEEAMENLKVSLTKLEGHAKALTDMDAAAKKVATKEPAKTHH